MNKYTAESLDTPKTLSAHPPVVAQLKVNQIKTAVDLSRVETERVLQIFKSRASH